MAKKAYKVPYDPVNAAIKRKVGRAAVYKPTLAGQAQERIAQAIFNDGGWSKSAKWYARDVSFHLVDWYTDLEELRAVIRRPERFTDREIDRIVGAFLAHAPHHIAAAHKIYAEEAIPDVFELGIHEDGPPRKSACLGPPMPRKKQSRGNASKRTRKT